MITKRRLPLRASAVVAALACLLAVPAVTQATPLFTFQSVPMKNGLQNDPANVVKIYVNDTAVSGNSSQGFTLGIKIGDGGSDAVTNATTSNQTGPYMTAVDTLSAGLMFSENNKGDANSPFYRGLNNIGATSNRKASQIWQNSLSVNAGTVPITNSPTLLAIVQLDTRNISPGVYSITMKPGAGLPTTTFSPYTASNTGEVVGTITITPEPASIGVFGLGMLGLLARRRRAA